MNGGFSVGYFRQDGTPTTSEDPAGMAYAVDAHGHRVTGWTSEGPSTDDLPADDGTGYVTGSAYARLQLHHDAELKRLGEAIHRVNMDWDEVARNCGDPKCHGDCRWVRVLREHAVR